MMGQRILITGGASGLGRALAEAWLQKGARVAIADVQAERLQQTQTEFGEQVLALRLDVRSEEDWAAAASAVEQAWGGLDVLVNNAGIASGGPVEREPLAEWERVLDINLLGLVRGVRACLPLLQQSRGRILNVASMAGLIHPPMMGSYNATKAAVVAWSETLSFELEDQGIGVHVLCPGFFKTNLTESLPPQAAAMKAVLTRIFDRSGISAEEVAAAALAGIQKGDFQILSHPEGRAAWRMKRAFPDTLYRKLMKKQTAGMARAFAGKTP